MNTEQEKHAFILRGIVIAAMVILAAMLRVVPHPFNLTPIGAIALFSGAMFRKSWFAFVVPLASLFAGDIFVGFHKLMVIVYASFAVSVVIGRRLSKNRNVARIGGAVFLGALQFFVITNVGLWAIGGFYPKTAAGLGRCLVAGVPFFGNALAGDLLYAGILFGGFALAETLLPALRLPDARTTQSY